MRNGRTTTKRGQCSECGQMIALRNNGTLRGHGAGLRLYSASWCQGSSLPPIGGITITTESRSDDRSVSTRNNVGWFEDYLGEPRL